MIGERFNFEDVFFRDLTICVLDTLEGEIKWVNKFSSGDRVVNVPFYYSMTGDERFLLDSFTDDVVSNSRYVDLNTDIIPRGHLTLTSYEIRADEFANPNVWLKMVVENNNEIRNMLTKLRAIPITVKYDLVLHLSSEIDTFKCSQAILDTLWLYRFMYFEYNFLNIDAVMQIPDSSSIEINREKNLTSDNTIKLTVSFDVQTYYPAYRKPKLPDLLPYTIQTGYPSKNVNIKIELVQSVNNQVAYSEFHNSTSSSDGTVVLQIGAGSALVGSYLNVNFNTAGLKIKTYVDPNSENNYEIISEEDLEIVYSSEVDYTKEGLGGPGKSGPTNVNYQDKNLAWSNSYTNLSDGGDFRDVIIYPKKTRWYNNLIGLKGPGNAKGSNPYNSQDLNNQKKV
jgi:hypothetical protein